MNRMEIDTTTVAVIALFKDNPRLLTTDGLSTLLSEYCLLSLNDISQKQEKYEPRVYKSLQDKEVMLGVAGLTSELEPVFKRMAVGKFFNFRGLDKIMLYHKVRNNIQGIQIMYNISSIKRRNSEIRGKKISHLDYDSQLVLLEADKAKLSKSTITVARDFIKLVKQEPRYDLTRVEYNDEDEQEEYPTTYLQIQEYASSAVYAYVRAESHNWELTYDGHYRSVGTAFRSEADKITLTVAMGWDGDFPADCVEFVATHPDKTRFLWLIY